jgi:precorrin-6A synthase
MRKIFIIGMGAGNPDYMTVQAIDALNKVDVFFIPDQGHEKAALRTLRTDICARFIKDRPYRLVEVAVPKRRDDGDDYTSNVAEWHASIEANYLRLLRDDVAEDECAGFLVWGDPALYDSTLRIVENLHAKADFGFDYEVIPGISAIQALAARHRVPLNRIGEPIHITTGRKLTEADPSDAESVVVMLDGEQSFQRLSGDVDIYWGAYLGTPDEVLISGKLSEVADKIAVARAEKRERNGWIMDTYLIRRPAIDRG